MRTIISICKVEGETVTTENFRLSDHQEEIIRLVLVKEPYSVVTTSAEAIYEFGIGLMESGDTTVKTNRKSPLVEE